MINPSLCRQARSEAPTLHDTGKSLSVWVRLGRAKRLHAKEVLHDALSPIAHGGIGKSLRVWVGLGRVDRPHVKSGTYYASVFRF